MSVQSSAANLMALSKAMNARPMGESTPGMTGCWSLVRVTLVDLGTAAASDIAEIASFDGDDLLDIAATIDGLHHARQLYDALDDIDGIDDDAIRTYASALMARFSVLCAEQAALL